MASTPPIGRRAAPRQLPEPPDEPTLVNFLDLDGHKIERIEAEGGAPIGQAPTSVHQRLAAVVAAVYEVPFGAAQPLSFRELARYVRVTDSLEAADASQDDGPGEG